MPGGAFASSSARATHIASKSLTIIRGRKMAVAAHPGRLLKRELVARGLSANRLSLDLGVPSGRITDILNARRAITADTAVRLGRFFGHNAPVWVAFSEQAH